MKKNILFTLIPVVALTVSSCNVGPVSAETHPCSKINYGGKALVVRSPDITFGFVRDENGILYFDDKNNLFRVPILRSDVCLKR